MASNGGTHDGAATGGGAALGALIERLRGGDLSVVFTIVARHGAWIAARRPAPTGSVDRGDPDVFVQDVVLALAERATAPDAAGRTTDELLSAAIRACRTPSAAWGPATTAAR